MRTETEFDDLDFLSDQSVEKSKVQEAKKLAEEKLRRAEEMMKKAQKAKENAKKQINQSKEIERKARNHRLILLGALVEMVLGRDVDKGLLTGLLIDNAALFSGDADLDEIAATLKYKGDSYISARESAKKQRKAEESDG